MDHPGLATVSAEAKDLVRRLLRVDPKLRLTARAALAHPWLRDATMIDRAKDIASSQLQTG